MKENPDQEPKRKKRAGSINQYATLGKPTQTSERADVQTSESQRDQESGAQTSEAQRDQESGRADVQTPESLKRERQTVYLPPDLSEWVKIRAVKTKREISEVVTEAVERYRTEVEGF